MSGSLDRGGRNDLRQRRAFQRLSNDPFGSLGIIAGEGIVIDSGDGSIAVLLATVTPGLAFTNGLTINLRDTDPGLELVASGLGVLLGANPALTLTGGLAVDLRDTDPGLELVASGLGVLLGGTSGLTTTSGLQILLSQSPSILLLGAGGLGTKFVTVTGSAGSESVLMSGGSGGTVEVRQPASVGGRFVGSSSSAIMRLGVAGASVTITSASEFDLTCVGGAAFRVFNSSTGKSPGGPALELLSSSARLQGFSGPIVIQPRAPVAGTGAATTVIGGKAVGSNQNGGDSTIQSGQPTGAGTSILTLASTTNAGAQVIGLQTSLSAGNKAQLGFFGSTPIGIPVGYTITAAPAVATALDCDANGGAYGAFTLTELNDLRADVASLAAVVRQLIKHLGDTSGLGLVEETSY